MRHTPLLSRVLLVMIFVGPPFLSAENVPDPAPSKLPESKHQDPLDLEQLANVEITTAAGYTRTDARRVPVTMTDLDAVDVEQSGARDLNHLLELYVPNLQFIDHHHLESHLGFRGIISDREDKYLYQVDGRTLNNRMWVGADNERGLPLMGDIRKISIVRGPASVTHGPGALAGVINVETYDGLSFQGADFSLRQDGLDQYSAGEARLGRRFHDGSGIFAYFGMADQPGLDTGYYIGHSYPATNGLPPNIAGQPLRAPIASYGVAGFDEPRLKTHLSFVKGPFEVWTRFVQDGSEDPPTREIYSTKRPDNVSLADWVRGRQFLNRQSTTTVSFKKDLSEHWNLSLAESYTRWDFKDQRMGTQVTAPLPREGGEQEWFSRAIAVWSPTSSHSLAFGSEYSHETFNDPYFSDALDRDPVVEQRSWDTNLIAFLTEYQWKMGSRWTLFLGARGGKHTYSGWLVSPRSTLVFTPTDRDTMEIMVGRSVRRSGDEELWAQHVRLGTVPDPESLISYEFSYEHKFAEHWHVGSNTFFENYNAIGWIPALYYSSSIGRYRMAGEEIEAGYATSRTRLSISHGLTRLVSASIPPSLPPGGQAITAEPYGYGNNLAEWAPLITKVAIIRSVGKRWSLSSSAVHYSGFPGAQDFANYAATLKTVPSAMPFSDPGYTAPYGPNFYVNTGVEFHPSGPWSIRLDGYNLAALADETLSKRNYYFRMSEYSVQAASAALALQYHWGLR